MLIRVGRDRSITLMQGDITQQTTDAIVNAANSSLLPGGGVCGAIHHAGGPGIAHECAALYAEHGGFAPGQAVVTSAGRLKAEYVIHTIGPVWRGGSHGESDMLADCYHESIRLADSLRLTGIAFPSIATGIFGYPVHLAAPVALRSTMDALAETTSVRDVLFVLFDDISLRAYQTAATAILNDS
jgi:O-acetyl-ADP-ribose deacetylase